jgi:peroxiredoxin family protein
MMPCLMSMEVMEYNPAQDFKPNVTEPVGVAKFLEEADESRITLFI